MLPPSKCGDNLKKHATNVQVEYLFLRVIGRLKSLTLLNGTNVTESDAAAALRLNAGTRITPVSLIYHEDCR